MVEESGRVRCDNETVVEVLHDMQGMTTQCTCEDVFFIIAFMRSLKAVHILGLSNTIVDAISTVTFQSQVPNVAAKALTEIPHQ